MNYKELINKYSNANYIFKEELTKDISEALNINILKAIELVTFGQGLDSSLSQNQAGVIINEFADTCDNSKAVETELIDFLEGLNFKLLSNKTITQSFENSLIQMIRNIVTNSNGKVKYTIQAKLIFQTIGSIFSWKSLDISSIKNLNDIHNHIDKNMEDVCYEYPNLIETLKEVFVTEKFENNDLILSLTLN